MITVEQINKKNYPTDSIVNSNMETLKNRVNKAIEMMLAIDPSLSFTITSGLRSEQQQKDFIKAGKTKATKSKHLIGAALDILDEDCKIKDLLKANPAILSSCELWCEHWDYTLNWWHCQIIPPHSGNRWFIP